MVDVHGVNRCFAKVRINFPLTLGSGFHPLLFKEPRKLRANPVQLFMCSHNQLAKKCQNSCVLKDGYCHWNKRLEVSSRAFKSRQPYFIISSLPNKWVFYFSFLFLLFWVPQILMGGYSWSSVLWFGRLYFYQKDSILRISNSAFIKAPNIPEEV